MDGGASPARTPPKPKGLRPSDFSFYFDLSDWSESPEAWVSWEQLLNDSPALQQARLRHLFNVGRIQHALTLGSEPVSHISVSEKLKLVSCAPGEFRIQATVPHET